MHRAHRLCGNIPGSPSRKVEQNFNGAMKAVFMPGHGIDVTYLLPRITKGVAKPSDSGIESPSKSKNVLSATAAHIPLS